MAGEASMTVMLHVHDDTATDGDVRTRDDGSHYIVLSIGGGSVDKAHIFLSVHAAEKLAAYLTTAIQDIGTADKYDIVPEMAMAMRGG